MKRIFAMLLAMVMVFAMVTGCSKKANKESNDNSDPSASVVQTITIKADGIEGMSADVTLTLKGVNGASTMSVNGSVSATYNSMILGMNGGEGQFNFINSLYE